MKYFDTIRATDSESTIQFQVDVEGCSLKFQSRLETCVVSGVNDDYSSSKYSL